MKIAYFHTNTMRSSWTLWSAAQQIRRLGNTCLDCPVPTDLNGRIVPNPTGYRIPGLPTLDDLKTCNYVIVCAAEYCEDWLREYYGPSWDVLIKWAIFVESTQRSDIRMWRHGYYDRSLCADPEDVSIFGGEWFPPHVDTEMFRPAQPDLLPRFDPWKETPPETTIDVGFMGTLYRKRAEFLNLVQTPVVCGQVSAWGMRGEQHLYWAHLYVEALWSMKIHLDLPSNNPMPTARPYETMATGTCLVTWAKLPEPLTDMVDYVRYSTAHELDEKLTWLLRNDEARLKIGHNGRREMLLHFRAIDAWKKILTNA